MKPFFLKAAAPIPKIISHKRALFVGPHPDDIEIGAGATISKLVSLGIIVGFAIITDGGSGSFDAAVEIDDLIKRRHEEALHSAQVLGVSETYFLNFPDGAKYDEWDVAVKLAEIIIQFNPDIIFAPDPNLPSEVHPDHAKAGNSTKHALLISSSPLTLKRNMIFTDQDIKLSFNRTLAFYYTHRPNQFVSVSKNDISKSQAAILKHISQFQDNTQEWSTLKMYLSYRRRRFGTIFNPIRDGFFVLGPIHQHCFPEVNEF